MEEMGKKPTEEELEKFMKEVDLDGNGTVGMRPRQINPAHSNARRQQLTPAVASASRAVRRYLKHT